LALIGSSLPGKRSDGSDRSDLKLAACASFFHCENGSRMLEPGWLAVSIEGVMMQ
jgi:hypothetical protein